MTEMQERDIFECANQLGGYVGPDTPEKLARFLIRESEEAVKLAQQILVHREDILTLERERDEARLYASASMTAKLETANGDLLEKLVAAEAQVQALREALERSVGALNMLTEPEAIKVTNVSGAWAECVAAISIARAALRSEK